MEVVIICMRSGPCEAKTTAALKNKEFYLGVSGSLAFLEL